jgi:putative endonuclease
MKTGIQEHQQGLVEGFTRKYQFHRLVYYESTLDMSAALRREKQLITPANKTRNYEIKSL